MPDRRDSHDRRLLVCKSPSVLAFLATVQVFLFSGCVYVSRSDWRKLQNYDTATALQLEPTAMRLAVELDPRGSLDLGKTGIYLLQTSPVRQQETFFRIQVSPAPEKESSLARLPAPRPPRVWRLFVIAKKTLDASRELRSAFASQGANALKAPSRADFLRWFPDLKLPPPPGEFGFDENFILEVNLAPGESRARFPLRVWILLDAKDGYFRLIDRVVDLDQQYKQ